MPGIQFSLSGNSKPELSFSLFIGGQKYPFPETRESLSSKIKAGALRNAGPVGFMLGRRPGREPKDGLLGIGAFVGNGRNRIIVSQAQGDAAVRMKLKHGNNRIPVAV